MLSQQRIAEEPHAAVSGSLGPTLALSAEKPTRSQLLSRTSLRVDLVLVNSTRVFNEVDFASG